MKTVIVTHSEKGGVGKSTMAIATADYIRNIAKVPVAIYDGDSDANKSLFNIFSKHSSTDPVLGVVGYNAHSDSDGGKGMLIDSLSLEAADIILHDMPAGSMRIMDSIISTKDSLSEVVEIMEANDARMTFVYPVTASDNTSFKFIRRSLDITGTSANHLVVLNMKEPANTLSNMRSWLNSDVRQQFIDVGGIEIELPHLKDFVRNAVIEARMPFSEGVKNPEFSKLYQSVLHIFMKKFTANIEPARKILGLG